MMLAQFTHILFSSKGYLESRPLISSLHETFDDTGRGRHLTSVRYRDVIRDCATNAGQFYHVRDCHPGQRSNSLYQFYRCNFFKS